ncbi:hypothetical protein BDAP_000737 [Binucleata daphniae]
MSPYVSAYVNLLKTAIGSGILSYPYLFFSYGTVLTFIISMIAACFSFSGLVFYIICNHKNQNHNSLRGLALSFFPSASIITDGAMCFKCFGVAVSYLIIVRQLLPLLLIYIFGDKFFTSPEVSLFIFLILTSPLSYFKNLDRLKYTSFLGLVCILCVVFASFYRVFETENLNYNQMKYITPVNVLWFTGLGKIVFSFTCHQNIFTVQSEIQDNSKYKLIMVSFATVLTAFCVYIVFGYTNYLIFGNLIKDNVLEVYPKDLLATLVQTLYVLVMGFSYPLQINPCRLYLLDLINYNSGKNNSNIVHFLSTTFLLLITYLIAVSGLRLGITYSLIGATASSLMCLILPGIFYLKIIEDKNKYMKVLAYVSVSFGLLIFMSSISNVLNF